MGRALGCAEVQSLIDPVMRVWRGLCVCSKGENPLFSEQRLRARVCAFSALYVVGLSLKLPFRPKIGSKSVCGCMN